MKNEQKESKFYRYLKSQPLMQIDLWIQKTHNKGYRKIKTLKLLQEYKVERQEDYEDDLKDYDLRGNMTRKANKIYG